MRKQFQTQVQFVYMQLICLCRSSKNGHLYVQHLSCQKVCC